MYGGGCILKVTIKINFTPQFYPSNYLYYFLTGKVDDDSPAQAAGLKEGDRIVEVNDDNIGQATHKDVVSRIKANPNETIMLVLDAEAEKYYRDRDIVVSHRMANVVTITCPDSKPTGR